MQRKAYQRESQEQRRDDLITATLDCVADDGVHGVTVRAIAARAGVTQGLIRHYFSRKEELVHEAYRMHMRQMGDAVASDDAVTAGSGQLRLAGLVRASLTPPVAAPRSVAIWASFVAMVPSDAAIAEIHKQEYLAFRDMIEYALADALRETGRRVGKRARTSMAIAINALIDGLWLEAGLAPGMFAAGELASLGLAQVSRITGLDLGSALEAAA